MKKIIRDNQLLLKKLLLIIYDIIAVSVSGYLALLMRFELEPSQIPEQFLNPYRRYNWIMIIVTTSYFMYSVCIRVYGLMRVRLN